MSKEGMPHNINNITDYEYTLSTNAAFDIGKISRDPMIKTSQKPKSVQYRSDQNLRIRDFLGPGQKQISDPND